MKIIDLHCDTLYKFYEQGEGYFLSNNDGHISEKTLKLGGYAAQCFAIYQPCSIKGEEGYRYFKNQYRLFKKIIENSKVLKTAVLADDIKKNMKENKISAVLTVENADYLMNDIKRLKETENCGVRFLGLIHNGENCIGYPHSDNKKYGLKEFGKALIEELNSTKIIADVSHLNNGGFWDVAKISKKPFVATHSGSKKIFNHSRNLDDGQIRALANSGGVIGTVFYSYFLNGKEKTELEDILLHLEQLINVGGQEVVALGSDYDGMDCQLDLKNASFMPILVDRIIKRFGYSLCEKICYKNAMRILSY